jgi:ATP-dependent helicase HrpB
MSLIPPLTELPVEGCLTELRTALDDQGHAVLQAPPGAGKTTIVPLRLLDEPWLDGARIVVLEPRRLAARAAARRMADLLGENVGETVGYRTRDEHHVGPNTRIEVVTEGILTRRLQRDASLPGVGLVVFDEIHERNLQADLALALTLDVRAILRPDLRILAMSATLDTQRVAALIGGPNGDGTPAPAVTSAGRSYPIEIRWRPPGPRDRPAEAAAAAALLALRTDPGDVLVFLAGAADIRRVGSLLATGVPSDVDVRPLFGALSRAEQDAALAPSPPGRRRVVLSTDIAETSLTVEGVGVVIDSGQVRSPRFDARSGLTRLQTGPNSRASADQRSGRAGRTGPGIAYRLWSSAEHAGRSGFAPPEITTVDLTGLALELAVWGTAAADLAFLDPPPARSLDEAHRLLVELGALSADLRVTSAGRLMAELPVHPRLAHMITVAATWGLGATACALAALVEERDVLRGRPDDLSADITERVRLIIDPAATHPATDRAALQLVRRRATELRRRAHLGDRTERADHADDPTACGLVLALAYPDRLAQARGHGQFRLRHGAGAWLPTGDALTGEAFLVVAELGSGGRPADGGGGAASHLRGGQVGDADQRIRLAAPLDQTDVERAVGDSVDDVSTLWWEPVRDDLRVRTERRLGALVLASSEGPAPVGDATCLALIERVRVTGLAILHWTPGARSLQSRAGFAYRALGSDWPDLSDRDLLATLDEWLEPHLMQATRRVDLERLDLTRLLRDQLGQRRLAELDRIVPTTLTLASGRTLTIDYSGADPKAAVRVQDLFGTTTHPTVAHGRVPVVIHLLSPAGRPVQVTADLPGFWAGSWSEVRKEMAGRYPKHDWPLDPAAATPSRPRPPRPPRTPA